MDARLKPRRSRESLAAESAIGGKTDKSQRKGDDEEDVGQGIITLHDHDKLTSKDKTGKQEDSKGKQGSKTVESPMVDILAIPGLEAPAKNTWAKWRRIANTAGDDPKNFKPGPNCLSDPTMLPDTLPNSRIMTVAYASSWLGILKDQRHQPVSNRVEEVADMILMELKRLRKNCSKRPIILVGHSLGGVIVEKTVVKAKVQSEYLEIYNSIAGCVFLGTPFTGSECQAKAALAAKGGSLLKDWSGSRLTLAEYTPLLELMKKDSNQLKDLLTDFLNVVNDATIQTFCFYEKMATDISAIYKKVPVLNLLPSVKQIVADEDMSTLQGKPKLGLNRNHWDMNKFEGNRDREWVSVSSVIENMASKAGKALKRRRNALSEKITSEQYMDILTKLAALEADPDNDLRAIEDERGQAVTDSGNLIFQNEKIKSWHEATQTGILWISLHPGMSSAMYAVAIQKRVEKEVRDNLDEYLCYFFCDSQNTKKDNTYSILKAFIRQMLKTSQSLALHMPFEQIRTQGKKQGNGGYSSWDSFENLRIAFLAMLRDPIVSSITFVIDSLHKIDEESRPDLLDLIDESMAIAMHSDSKMKMRWICLGLDRPDITTRLQKALTVTAEDLGSKPELIQSLKSLVRNRVTDLSDSLGYSREYAFWLRVELLKKAEGNTTWVDLAVGEIASVAPKPIDLRTFAQRLKQDLNPLYKQIQSRVFNPNAEGLEYTKEILRTLLISFHNPTLQEIAVLSGLPQDIWDDVDEIRKYVMRCGSFLKIISGRRHDRVHFTDLTAVEFLTKEAAEELGHDERLKIQDGVIALRCLNFLINSADHDHPSSKVKATYPKRFWLDHALRASGDLPELIEDFGLDTDFWNADSSVSWWPSTLKGLWPKLHNFTTVHLAAYFDFSTLLDQLLADDSVHKDEVEALDALGRTPLYWACYQGHDEIAKKLVSYGASVNAKTDNATSGLAPLYGAAESGEVEIVKWLLEKGATVDVRNTTYGTALCGAAVGGHKEVVEILLRAGASKFAPPNWPRGNALTAALASGHLDLAKMLTKERFDVNVPDANDKSALEWAAQAEDPELVSLLLTFGANLKSRQAGLEAAALAGFGQGAKLILQDPRQLSLRQPLLHAAGQGFATVLDHFPIHLLTQIDLDDAIYHASDMEKLEAVEKLLSMGASPNAKGEVYGTALIASAWDGTTDIMKTLIAHGANVNEVAGDYGTALQAAAYQGDADNILLLLKSGARINDGPLGTYGNALYAACAANEMEAVKVLVDHRANLNARGGEHNYPLLAAADAGNFEMVKYLIEHDAYIDVKTDDGSNVMLLASYTLPKEDLEWLWKQGGDIHVRSNENFTVLIGCAWYQDVPSVQWLVEEVRVDINVVSQGAGSALQAAAAQGNEEICEILLMHGANPNQTDENHPPPLLKAAMVDDKPTFDILLAYRANIKYNSNEYGNIVEAAIEGDAAQILEVALQQSGFPINSLLREQGTALHMACRREYGKEVSDLLLEKGADVNVVGGKYHTPLQAAAYKGFTNLANRLLQNGADNNIRGGFYGTAANAACAKGRTYIIDELLEEEGGPAVDEGLHYAIHYHENYVVENLLKHRNADITSKGKWGNVFQALSTALTENETNSDDEEDDDDDDDSDEEDEDGDEGAGDDGEETESEDEDEDEDDSDEDDEGNQEDEDEFPVLADEEKVKRIDALLRAAFEEKGIDPDTLPKEPVKADLKRSKSFARVLRKNTRAAGGATRGQDTVPHMSEAPPMPTLDTSTFNRNSMSQAQQAGARAGEYIKGFFSGLSNNSTTTTQSRISNPVPQQQQQPQSTYAQQPTQAFSAQQRGQGVSPQRQATTNSVSQTNGLPSTLAVRQPTVTQARVLYTYIPNTDRALALAQNETVTVLDTSNSDWWKVRKADGTTAYAPANHMTMIQPGPQQDQPKTIARKQVGSQAISSNTPSSGYGSETGDTSSSGYATESGSTPSRGYGVESRNTTSTGYGFESSQTTPYNMSTSSNGFGVQSEDRSSGGYGNLASNGYGIESRATAYPQSLQPSVSTQAQNGGSYMMNDDFSPEQAQYYQESDADEREVAAAADEEEEGEEQRERTLEAHVDDEVEDSGSVQEDEQQEEQDVDDDGQEVEQQQQQDDEEEDEEEEQTDYRQSQSYHAYQPTQYQPYQQQQQQQQYQPYQSQYQAYGGSTDPGDMLGREVMSKTKDWFKNRFR